MSGDARNVQRRDAPVLLRHAPMLDAQMTGAKRKARGIAYDIQTVSGPQRGVDHYPAVVRRVHTIHEAGRRTDAYAQNDEIRRQPLATLDYNRVDRVRSPDAFDLRAQPEDGAVRRVQTTKHHADL